MSKSQAHPVLELVLDIIEQVTEVAADYYYCMDAVHEQADKFRTKKREA